MKNRKSQDYEYSDSLGGWNIIYPSRVYDAGVDHAKETKEQGFRSALILLGMGCVAAFLIISSILKSTFGLSSFWAFILVGLVISIIGVYIFRFFIFKEEDKLEEFSNEESDNLGKYFNLLTGQESYIDMGQFRIPFYKYSNGSFAICMKLRHGSTTVDKKYNTRRVMMQVADIIGRYKLNYKQLIKEENFQESNEYKAYIDKINNIKDERFRGVIREIATYNFEKSKAESLVDCTYLIIKAKNAYQREQIGRAILEIKSLFDRTPTVYRDYSFLDFNEYIELCREYFGVDVIDLTTIRTTTPDRDVLSAYRNLVYTVEVILDRGKSISYDDKFEKPFITPKIKDL